MDSARKSEPEDSKDVVDLELIDTCCDLSDAEAKGEGGSLHSGLTMMPAIPSRRIGLSVPEIV